MTGRVRVPGDLAGGAGWALRDRVEGVLGEFYGSYRDDPRALRRRRPRRPPPPEGPGAPRVAPWAAVAPI